MKILKIVYKFLCFASLFIVIMSIKNTSIVTVTKATNTNPNKNLNLNAMARLINTFRDNDINYPKDTYASVCKAIIYKEQGKEDMASSLFESLIIKQTHGLKN